MDLNELLNVHYIDYEEPSDKDLMFNKLSMTCALIITSPLLILFWITNGNRISRRR